VLAMVVGMLLVGVAAVAYEFTSTHALRIDRSRDVDAAEAVAEGVLDYMYAVWRGKLREKGKAITTTEAAALMADPPELPAGMSYVHTPLLTNLDRYGTPVEDPVYTPGLTESPDSWFAYIYEYLASVTIRLEGPSGKGVTVNLARNFKLQSTPPTGVFFYTQGNFELYRPAAKMVVGGLTDGKIHTNKQGLVSTHYTSSADKLRFMSNAKLTYVDSYAHAAPYGAQQWAGVSPNKDTIYSPTYDLGFNKQVTQTDELESIGLGTAAQFNTKDQNPNNDGNRELIEPPDPNWEDPAPIATSRTYNNAGIRIKVNGLVNKSATMSKSGNAWVGGNVEIHPQNGTQLTKNQAEKILGALSNSKTVTVYWTEIEYYTDNRGRQKTRTVQKSRTEEVPYTIYDRREGKDVEITSLDISKLRGTINDLDADNSVADDEDGFNGLLYIHVPGSTYQNPKAIRVFNGQTLPEEGLTIASENGIYLQGDYNTGGTPPSTTQGNPNNTDANYVAGYIPKPAALIGDAVMLLSNAWDDSKSTASLSNRAASHTTHNTAIISGYLPSGWVNPHTGEKYWYSGGMNNFPRYLEDWTNKDHTFFGSMVQLFISKTFVGEWDTGSIYAPPARKWNFSSTHSYAYGIPPASSMTRGEVVLRTYE
jgi:hypothetical protein